MEGSVETATFKALSAPSRVWAEPGLVEEPQDTRSRREGARADWSSPGSCPHRDSRHRGSTQPGPRWMLAIYEVGNENPDGFRVTSRHVVATARRQA